ncbi:hypothetical protein N657DRAFT_330025 [Parathielavia appendiculata]|uniref:Zn(2)-C6 fungal-type domain-containing protein n=1 Tax=Parathielavia appendiculata TaxID=2587402 RepID=A0AAN6TRD7_9PEZI|nr:hypothetical protein N657DRAFT_330025 [Parathielavia appendiculata]
MKVHDWMQMRTGAAEFYPWTTTSETKMLLYTRVAPPKQPKRRSRGGCTYCKEKKKKCDEQRPKCTRCVEHGVECAYEAVKPRQRRRRESATPASPSSLHLVSRRFSDVSRYSHGTDFGREDGILHGLLSCYLDDPLLLSPSDSNFEGLTLPPLSPSELLDGHEDAPSEEGNATTGTAVVPRSKSFSPDLAMIAPCPVSSPLLDFSAPTFSEFSDKQNRRALVDHFCNVLSHLIVFREETGNPFQQLVLPLTQGSSPVKYAIFALACAHLEYRGVENAEKSLYFQNMAVRGVAQLIQHSSKASRNEILASIMLLVYYETLVQSGHSNIVAGHLKGALTIMGTAPDPADSTSVFLERAFRFYDVITALSNGTTPLSPAPSPGCLQPLSPLGAPSVSPLCNVDTLLGMATTLWPIIHRLAGLRALKTELETAVLSNETPSKIAVLRTEFESTAQAIETALLQWQPQLPPGFTPSSDDTDLDGPESTIADAAPQPADGSIPDTITTTTVDSPIPTHPRTPPPPRVLHSQDHSRIASIHNNALAYRHASLVYLYRSVLGHPRAHPSVQSHTHLALSHCVATVQHKGPMSALLWPLFVSACEALPDSSDGGGRDRKLAERAFVEVEKRQGMRNIERAWGIVREVWRRGDELAASSSCSASASAEAGSVVVGMDDGGELEGVVGASGVCGADAGREEMWRRVCREMGVSIVFG